MNMHRLAPLFLLFSLNLGCAGILGELGAGEKRDGWQEVNEAIRNGDEAKLKELCEDESLGPLDNRYPRYKACREHEALQLNKDTGDCNTVVERFKKARMSKNELAFDYHYEWATRLAKCEKYKEIFEEIAHRGEGGEKSSGVKVLLRLEQDGLPVLAEFGKYASENPGPAFLNIKPAGFAGNHLGHWLALGGHLDQCPLLAKTLENSPEAARAALLGYFVVAKCQKKGNALALSLLTAEVPDHRIAACSVLGKLGTDSELKKVKLLAESDSFFVVVEKKGMDGRLYGEKVFTVRDACKDAMTKILLRSDQK